MAFDPAAVGRAFSEHRFDEALDHLARDVKWTVVGGMVLGLVFDNSAGTSPAGVLVGIALGVVVGCVVFWLRVRSALRD